MTAPITPDNIDPVIHEKVRLLIVATLAMVQEISFNDLKDTLSLTDGNLSAHARKLEDSGYIEVTKSFRSRRPHTTMRLTNKGRLAYQKYIAMLKEIVKQGEQS